MGGQMSKILPGLYVGNIRDAKHREKLTENNITHILAIHDNAKKLLDDKEYLCIEASDNAYQDLTQFFPECIEFIHKARLSGGAVLVHCLAGVSRSVTVTAAYLMTATSLNWREALNAIRGARNHANPNFGFQKQLQNYQNEQLEEAREKLKEQFPDDQFNDEADCHQLLQCFKHYVLTGESPTGAPGLSAPKSERDGLYPLPANAYSSKAKRGSTLDADAPAMASSQEGEAEAESEAASPEQAAAVSFQKASSAESE